MTTVSVRMAAASGEDIKLAWAVYRAAQRLQYENWNYSACDIDFENLSRLEKLFFLRCYKFAVEEGAFNRIFGGYETLFANVCDPTSNVLDFKPSLAKQLQDGELLPVVMEAYEEARRAGVCEWSYDESEYSWHGQCGANWTFFEDGPAENRMAFCPGCGKPVKVASHD